MNAANYPSGNVTQLSHSVSKFPTFPSSAALFVVCMTAEHWHQDGDSERAQGVDSGEPARQPLSAPVVRVLYDSLALVP
jgi:hypothetical protein